MTPFEKERQGGPGQLRAAAENIAQEHEYEIKQYIMGRGRYEYAVLEDQAGQRAVLKLGLVEQKDIDEPVLLHNLQREVWFARVVKNLREWYKAWSESNVSTHEVLATNITPEGCDDSVGFILYKFSRGDPLAGGVLGKGETLNKDFTPEQIKDFPNHIPAICAALHVLESTTPDTVQRLNVPLSAPRRAHGEKEVTAEIWEYLMDRKFIDGKEQAMILNRLSKPRPAGQELVLGQGDFEAGHLMLEADGTLMITDNEFAGWYPRYDSLTYMYHRLWANRRQPKLAQALLTYYVEHYVPRGEREEFLKEFIRLLLPRLVRGAYYDATRRGLMNTAENQVLRRDLIFAILENNQIELTGSTTLENLQDFTKKS